MSETITIQVRASDFEVDRAINAYIPILASSYQLANGLPFSLPDGYQENRARERERGRRREDGARRSRARRQA